jgi:hypothetical protein
VEVAKTLKCPDCGQRGSSDDSAVFESLGVYKGRPLLYCTQCHAEFIVPIIGGPKRISFEESMALHEQRMDRKQKEFADIFRGEA